MAHGQSATASPTATARRARRDLADRPFPCADRSLGPESVVAAPGEPRHVLGNVSEWTWQGDQAAVAGWSWREGRTSELVRVTEPNRRSDDTGVRLWRFEPGSAPPGPEP